MASYQTSLLVLDQQRSYLQDAANEQYSRIEQTIARIAELEMEIKMMDLQMDDELEDCSGQDFLESFSSSETNRPYGTSHEQLIEEIKCLQTHVNKCQRGLIEQEKELENVNNQLKSLEGHIASFPRRPSNTPQCPPISTSALPHFDSDIVNEPYIGCVSPLTPVYMFTPPPSQSPSGLLLSPMPSLSINTTMSSFHPASYSWPLKLNTVATGYMSSRSSFSYTLLVSPLTPVLQPVVTTPIPGWQILPQDIMSPYNLVSPLTSVYVGATVDPVLVPEKSLPESYTAINNDLGVMHNHSNQVDYEKSEIGNQGSAEPDIGQLRRSMSMIDQISAGVESERGTLKRKSF